MKHFIFLFSLALSSILTCQQDQESKLIVVRHGEGYHNLVKLHNSNPLHPNYFHADLTDLGRAQVAETAKKLLAQGFNKDNIDLVIVSPLPRTLQTAEILAEYGLFNEKYMVIDSRVIEVNAGDEEGQTVLTATGQKQDWYNWQTLNGETNKDIRDRMEDIYQAILKKSVKGNVLIVTHGLPSFELIRILTGEPIQLGTAEAKVLSLIKQS